MLRYFGGVPVLLVPDNLLCGAPHKRFYVESAVMWSHQLKQPFPLH
jgi:hypothetical protein